MASEVLPELLEAVRRFVDKRLIPLEARSTRPTRSRPTWSTT